MTVVDADCLPNIFSKVAEFHGVHGMSTFYWLIHQGQSTVAERWFGCPRVKAVLGLSLGARLDCQSKVIFPFRRKFVVQWNKGSEFH